MEHVEHKYGPGETVQAVIRKYNHLKPTQDVPKVLSDEFLKLNGTKAPRVGEKGKIPVQEKKKEAQPKAKVNEKPRTKEEAVFTPPRNEVPFPIEIMDTPTKTKDNDTAMLRRQKRRELARANRDGIELLTIDIIPLQPEEPEEKEVEVLEKPKKRRIKRITPVVNAPILEDTPADVKKALTQERKDVKRLRKRRK